MFIYIITNTINRKVYIGKTLKKKAVHRWAGHLWALRNNQHGNKHLQHAWNKYGPDVWRFAVLAKAKTRGQLNKLEIQYIAEHQSTNSRYGYNQTSGGEKNYEYSAESVQRLARRMRNTWKKDPNYKCRIYTNLISPTGTVYTEVKNMAIFCRKHRLHAKSMRQVAIGTKRSYKGWTCSNFLNQYDDATLYKKRAWWLGKTQPQRAAAQT